MLILHVSTRFKRSFKRMPAHIKDDFAIKIDQFKQHPFSKGLETHKLSGNLEEYYAFYLRNGFRVLFEFMGENEVLLVNIGSHNDYKKWGK